MSDQDTKFAATGTTNGLLYVTAAATGHVLLDDGVALHRSHALNTVQARELAATLIAAADAVEGV